MTDKIEDPKSPNKPGELNKKPLLILKRGDVYSPHNNWRLSHPVLDAIAQEYMSLEQVQPIFRELCGVELRHLNLVDDDEAACQLRDDLLEAWGDLQDLSDAHIDWLKEWPFNLKPNEWVISKFETDSYMVDGPVAIIVTEPAPEPAKTPSIWARVDDAVAKLALLTNGLENTKATLSDLGASHADLNEDAFESAADEIGEALEHLGTAIAHLATGD